MRFAGKIPNFYDRGVDFGSRHGVMQATRANEQAKAFNIDSNVHNAGIERDTLIAEAKADAMGYAAQQRAQTAGMWADTIAGGPWKQIGYQMGGGQIG